MARYVRSSARCGARASISSFTARVFEELERRGLVYPCFCSRATLGRAVAALETRDGEKWPRDPDGASLYPGTCRELEPDEAAKRIARRRAACLAPSHGRGERDRRPTHLARA